MAKSTIPLILTQTDNEDDSALTVEDCPYWTGHPDSVSTCGIAHDSPCVAEMGETCPEEKEAAERANREFESTPDERLEEIIKENGQ